MHKPLALAALLALCAPCLPQSRAFAEGVHGSCRLEYVGEIPVLRLQGTPAEMGEAAGALMGGIIRPLASEFVESYLKFLGAEPGTPAAERHRDKVRDSLAGVPEERLAEMRAIARGAKVDPELVLMANLLPELTGRVRCSTLFVGAARMSDGAPCLGRNLDYPPLAGLERFGLVVVYREQGRRALASFTFPGLVGVLTGLNEDGLFGATMDVMKNARKFRPNAIPRFLFYRELLARHGTVESVLGALDGTECLSGGNLMLADAGGRAAVLESTGARWAVRKPERDMLYATNHFASPALGGPSACERFEAFAERDKTMERFTPRYFLGMIRMAALKPINVQALVVRPATGSMLFAFGQVPAATGRFHPLERNSLFAPGPPPGALGEGSR